jgi:DeoR family ulaG and ulaABCDEF operon transcriptional repressor
MHAAEREHLILSLLVDRGFVAFQDLDSRVDASPATIRRDLEKLEGAGKITRVRGGARLVRAPERDQGAGHLSGVPFHENLSRNLAAKRAIGAAAAALCRNGDSIIIDGGSTTLQMCPHLEELNLQVLTNSLHIVSALVPQPNVSLMMPAGTLFREQNIILSPYDDDGLSHYRASRIFMGAAAVGQHGVMQTDVILVQAERRLIALADELVLLVDSSKLEAQTGHVVCGLKEVGVLITDDGISQAAVAMIEGAVKRLIVVSPDKARPTRGLEKIKDETHA